MEQYTLYNGMRIPCIGYGTYPQEETLVKNIPLSYRCGYRLTDASDNYHNEEFIGQGMAALGEEGKRSVVMITKFSNPFRSGTLEVCFEESFRKLGNSDVKVYLMHWPYPFLWKYQWRKMEELYLAGKCQAIGVCNYNVKMLNKLLKFCKVKPMINQFERHPLFQQNELAELCRSNDIQVMSYTPVGRVDENLLTNSILKEIADRHHKSVVQVILRWQIEHQCLPIPAASSEGHMAENIDIFDFSLTDEEVKRIDSLETNIRLRYDPDKRFTAKQKLKFLLFRIRIMLKGK